MTIAPPDTDVALGQHPMLIEWRPGIVYQTPLAKYNLVGDDAALTNSAFAYLFGKYGAGTVKRGPFTFTDKTTINVPYVAPMYFEGSGPDATLNNWVGTGDWLRMYNNYVPSGGSSSILVWGGGCSNMSTFGLSNGTQNGIHTGDMKRARFTNLNLHHFSGGIAMWVDNTLFWTEDCIFDYHSQDTGVALQLDVHGGTNAHDNCIYHVNMGQIGANNQNGVNFINGANLYHTVWYLHGGIRSSSTPTTSTLLNFFPSSGTSIAHSFFIIQMESDGGAANKPTTMNLPAGCSINGGFMYADFMNSYNSATIGGQFQVSGHINGDNTMANHVPASPGITLGTPFTNPQNDAVFCLTGGTVTAVLVNGVTTGQTSGPFIVTAGSTIQINGSVLPTINVYSMIAQG